MKRKILAVLTIVMASLVAMTSLFGCANTKLSKIYSKEYAEDVPVYGTLSNVVELEGYTAVTTSSFSEYLPNNLVVLRKYETNGYMYKVFNMKTGMVVYSVANDASIINSVSVNSFYVEGEIVDYIVNKKTFDTAEDYYVTELLDSNGQQIAAATSNDYALSVYNYADLLMLDGTYYRANEEGSFTYAFEEALAQIPADEFEFVNEKYYYFESDESGVNTIYVYDKLTASPVSSYAIPTYVGEYNWFVLENGKIIVQYNVPVDSYSDDYDYAEVISGEYKKFNLETKLINPKNGNDTEIKTNVILLDVSSKEILELLGYNENLKNVATGVEINKEQKLIDEEVKYYTVNGRGSLSEIKDFIPGIEYAYFYNGYWQVMNDLGQIFLYNEKEELIGEISNVITATRKYLVTEDAIYDYALNKVYDLKGNNYTFVASLIDDVILEGSEGIYYVFSNGSVTALTSLTTTFVSNELMNLVGVGLFYGIYDGVNYTYYNTNKVSMGTFGSRASVIAYGEDYNSILVQSGNSFFFAQNTIVETPVK